MSRDNSSGIWYLGVPYEGHQKGTQVAFEHVTKAAAYLYNIGFDVYSPITMGHSIDHSGVLLGRGHDFWMRKCYPFMKVSKGLIVLIEPGFADSKGLDKELGYFDERSLPILFMKLAENGFSMSAKLADLTATN